MTRSLLLSLVVKDLGISWDCRAVVAMPRSIAGGAQYVPVNIVVHRTGLYRMGVPSETRVVEEVPYSGRETGDAVDTAGSKRHKRQEMQECKRQQPRETRDDRCRRGKNARDATDKRNNTYWMRANPAATAE